jgi:hypothetical protein
MITPHVYGKTWRERLRVGTVLSRLGAMLRIACMTSVAIGRLATWPVRLAARRLARWYAREYQVARDQKVKEHRDQYNDMLKRFVAVRLQKQDWLVRHNREVGELRQQIGVLEDRLRVADPESRNYIQQQRKRRAAIVAQNKGE